MDEKAFDQNGWIDIREGQPTDGERVLTWNNKSNEQRIQVFNEEYHCWDTEDGDDFEYSLDETVHDGRLVVSHWQSLPGKPVISQ